MNDSFADKISFLVQQGFFYPSGQIYGGLANSWDYGPLGSLMKVNLKKAWQHFFVQQQLHIFLLDSNILSLPAIWKASGHLTHFQDWQVECLACHKREKLEIPVSAWSQDAWQCAFCQHKQATEPQQFDLLFQTAQGTVTHNKKTVYLRAETAQGIFVNIKNIMRSTRTKLPFGVAQIGKAFRNEITPNNFIFRMREFEQMEIEWFTTVDRVSTDFTWWKHQMEKFLQQLHFVQDHYRWKEHDNKQLAHYAQRTADIEYLFPFGWSELWGLSYRGQYDLKAHTTQSKTDLTYFDQTTNQKILPEIIEPSVGVDRLLLAILLNAYDRLPTTKEDRIVLKLPYQIAPYQIAFLPLTKKQTTATLKLQKQLMGFFMTTFDDVGSIGKRYRRQDAIGTPFCVTFDYDSLAHQTVTIRHRDSMIQETVAFTDIKQYVEKLIRKDAQWNLSSKE